MMHVQSTLMSWSENLSLPPGLEYLEGWLQRKDLTVFSQWKKRYFKLEGDKLYWHRSKAHLEHLGFIDLRKVEVKERQNPRPIGTWQIEVIYKDGKGGCFLLCNSEEDMKVWLTGLQNWVHFLQDGLYSPDEPNVTTTVSVDPIAEARELLKSTGSTEDVGIGQAYIDEVFGKNSSSNSSNTSITEPSPDQTVDKSAQQDSYQQLKEKVKFLERVVKGQMQNIEELQQKIIDNDLKYQTQRSELISQFENKKKSFELLLQQNKHLVKSDKDSGTETPRAQDEIQQKNARIAFLEERVRKLESETTRNESGNSSQAKLMKQQGTSSSLEDDYQKLKQKFFFTLAINIKMMQSLSDMDVNALYSRIISEKIPVDEWDNWILQHANDSVF